MPLFLNTHRKNLREKVKRIIDERKEEDYSHILKLLDDSPNVAEFGVITNDLEIIDDIESWMRYQLRGESIAAVGKAAHPHIISTAQLISNIELGFVNQQKICEESPEKFLSAKLSCYDFSSEVSSLVCLALALELSHDPVIRANLRDAAKNHPVYLSTDHTLKGNSELNIYHLNYMAKRLVKMPLHEISGTKIYFFLS